MLRKRTSDVGRRVAPLGVLAAVIVLAIGCGDSSKKSSPSAGGTPAKSAPGAVSMKGLRFHPDMTTVRVGQKVTWRNDDSVDHNVTATGGAKFMSQAFGGGKTYSYTPRKAGTIAYVCTLHPGMTGKLVVTR